MEQIANNLVTVEIQEDVIRWLEGVIVILDGWELRAKWVNGMWLIIILYIRLFWRWD